MKDGKPNPNFVGQQVKAARELAIDPTKKAMNALHEQGLHRIRWAGSVARLREAGIAIVEKSFDRDSVPSGNFQPAWVKQRDGDKAREGHAGTEDLSYWAPRWAVLVAEAEPCNEAARTWALERAVRDSMFRDALMTVAALGDIGKMAAFVMAQWEPGNDG